MPAMSDGASPRGDAHARRALGALYRTVRAATLRLCEPLETEDMVVQTMPDASPTKWHLAHTSWFFETFVLRRADATYRVFDDRYNHLFNSYYNTVGDPFPRARRGALSRPTVADVLAHRRHVDDAMLALFERSADHAFAAAAHVIEVGLNHEEQHQELLVTDVKTVLAGSPLALVYRPALPAPAEPAPPLSFTTYDGGLVAIGHAGSGFAFDNEGPRHRVFLEPFALADRLVTCAEYLAFIEDGGYERPDLWLSDGWDERRRSAWSAPLYWRPDGSIATLGGARAPELDEPVCHVSFYEADAFARWAGARLPSEAEWEVVASRAAVRGNLAESGAFHPRAAGPRDHAPAQLFGDAWEWTASPYVAYPGYAPWSGELGEYNGKFMCNQLVLRGGSCATPERHVRATYRNFFGPAARWQFTGIRLAR
jgi:ergothioneine biosynthesis protein EgtB